MLQVDIPGLRLKNPTNQRGNTRLAAILRSKEIRAVRQAVRVRVGVALMAEPHRHRLPTVVVTRIAPRQLDAHDGLPASCKAVVDGIADALGLSSDADLEVEYRQERGAPRFYGVRIVLLDII